MATPNTTEGSIAGRYALIEQLGRGGMGIVWRAHDELLKRDVAIKEVDVPPAVPEAERGDIEARALREARVAARLGHPAAVNVFDVQRDNGKAYIVMELVHAMTLDKLVDEEGPIAPERAAEIGLRILGALEKAHSEGIVHRDVKPANIMVLPDGRVKLADFGIASLKDDPKITATGLVLGSPSYMAPEQAQGKGSGIEVDLWALGATLFFAVEGRPPFDRGQPIATLTAVLQEELPPMERAGPLEPVIRALLAKDPHRRPKASELCEMLEQARKPGTAEAATVVDEPVTPPPTRVATQAAPVRVVATPPVETTVPPAAPSAPHDRSRWPAIAAVAALLLIAGVVALTALLSGDDSGDVAANNRADKKAGARRGDGRGNNRPNAPQQPAVIPTPEPDVTPTATPAADEGWVPYQNDAVGYRIQYPSDWSVIEGSVDADSTDFEDPETSRYLRVDWTSPPGDDAVAAWEAQEASFRQEHSGYRRIQLAPTTFKGYEAAIWEFTFTDGGARVHAADLGFIVGDDYGFALYFSTLDEDWDAAQETFETFKNTFQAPG